MNEEKDINEDEGVVTIKPINDYNEVAIESIIEDKDSVNTIEPLDMNVL